jgi:signal transduction histidine kinase
VFSKPTLKEYAIARFVTIAIGIFLVFSTLLIVLIDNSNSLLIAVTVLALALMVFFYFIKKSIIKMQKELLSINSYLANFKNRDLIDKKTDFSTKEFADINENLIKVLNTAKKRESTKRKYNAKLKLKNRQRGDMISAIAHEFRNPIASIMGYSQTLQDDPNIPKPLQTKFLDKIYNNGNKIELLLSRLIMWNKFESGDANLHKSHFDISKLILSIKENRDDRYRHRDIIVELTPMVVDADRTLMEVVIKNLIENAFKYSKDEVIVKVENTTVSVKDSGVGIDKEDIEKVTKKFYRTDKHTWDNSMGLGLSIVKTILSLHNSELKIDSKLGKGSTFSFDMS